MGEKVNVYKNKKVILVLGFLIVISLFGIGYNYFLKKDKDVSNTITIPNNVIEKIDEDNEEIIDNDLNSDYAQSNNSSNTNDTSVTNDKKIEMPMIELIKNKPLYNVNFEVENMLPGDCVTQYFFVKTDHQYDVKVYFESTIVSQYKNLGEVLHIKVSQVKKDENGRKIVAEGSFNKMNGIGYPVQLLKNNQQYTEQIYRIDVYLDKSVGNEFQAAKLNANFKWYITDEEYNALLDSQNNNQISTGDVVDIVLWVQIAISMFILIVILIKSKEGNEDNDK